MLINQHLAKLDDGLAESPTVMVVDKTKLGKNRGILKPSWAFGSQKKKNSACFLCSPLNKVRWFERVVNYIS